MPTKDPMRLLWKGMVQRCTNPKNPQWKDYGGRGIQVKYKSFMDFVADAVRRPATHMTIERIDVNGHYEPGNVRWATRAEQAYNRRNARFVKIEGKQHRAMDLAKKIGVKTDTIINRVNRGLPMAEIMSPDKVFAINPAGWRAAHAKKRAMTHCCKGHEFTSENTYITPEGWRNCRECHRQKMRRRQGYRGMGG